MPTAAKLVAAIALAIAAYAASNVLLFHTEALQKEGISHRFFAIIGFLVGWSRLGPAAEKGYVSAWSGGISAALAVYLICCVLGACHAVYEGFFYHAFRSVDEMFDALFSWTIEYALYMRPWPVMLASVFGAMLAGTFAAMAGRIWR